MSQSSLPVPGDGSNSWLLGWLPDSKWAVPSWSVSGGVGPHFLYNTRNNAFTNYTPKYRQARALRILEHLVGFTKRVNGAWLQGHPPFPTQPTPWPLLGLLLSFHPILEAFDGPIDTAVAMRVWNILMHWCKWSLHCYSDLFLSRTPGLRIKHSWSCSSLCFITKASCLSCLWPMAFGQLVYVKSRM